MKPNRWLLKRSICIFIQYHLKPFHFHPSICSMCPHTRILVKSTKKPFQLTFLMSLIMIRAPKANTWYCAVHAASKIAFTYNIYMYKRNIKSVKLAKYWQLVTFKIVMIMLLSLVLVCRCSPCLLIYTWFKRVACRLI